MRTAVNKIIFGAIFYYLAWKGLDGLLVNYYSSSVFEVDISEVENMEINKYRFLKIDNGIAYDSFLYYENGSRSKIDVVYPLISAKQVASLEAGEEIEAKVFVKRNDLLRSCLTNSACFYKDSTSIKGLSLKGFDNLSEGDFASFTDDQLKVSHTPILLDADSEPISIRWNLLMFLGGGLFGFTIIKSFFRKAESIEDYWRKVTEKYAADRISPVSYYETRIDKRKTSDKY